MLATAPCGILQCMFAYIQGIAIDTMKSAMPLATSGLELIATSCRASGPVFFGEAFFFEFAELITISSASKMTPGRSATAEPGELCEIPGRPMPRSQRQDTGNPSCPGENPDEHHDRMSGGSPSNTIPNHDVVNLFLSHIRRQILPHCHLNMPFSFSPTLWPQDLVGAASRSRIRSS